MRRGPEGRTALAGALLALTAGCGLADAGELPPPLEDRTELESPAPPGSGEANLFAGADGRVFLTWFERREEGGHALRVSVLDDPGAANGDGAVWSSPRTISEGEDYFVNWADFPSLIALDDGLLAAHYPVRSADGTYDYDVYISWSADGGATWSEPVVPHRDGVAAEHGFVSLFPWHDGSLGAVWLDGRNFPDPDVPSEMTLRFTTLTPDALGPEQLLDGRICDCCQTSAALTSDGPIVVYRDRSPEEIRDISIVRYADGAWTDPEPVHRDGWVIPACPVNGPMVDADGRRVAVAWFTAADDDPLVRVAFSDDSGATFGDAIRVDGGTPAGRVAVRLLPSGDALVTWLERAGEGAEVRIRRVRPDGTAGPAETVAASSAARASGFPRMVRSGERLIFAWTDTTGEAPRVRVATARVPAP